LPYQYNKEKNKIKQKKEMKTLGYLCAFLGGAIAGTTLGLLVAPEKGKDTRSKLTGAVEDFLDKHNIKLTRKQVEDLVDDIKDAAPEELIG
jgi:hypothetical protein